MKKSLLTAILILCLILPSALAAPTRERDQGFPLSDAELLAVQPLLNTVAFTAFQKDIMSYDGDELPGQALVEGILLRALEERLFPVEMVDLAVTLTDQQVRGMAGGLFDWQDIPPIETPLCPCITRVAGGIRFDLSGQPDFIGVYAHGAAVFSEDTLIVMGDVYHLSGIEGMAEDAPEDSILWLGHIEIALSPAKNAQAGYTLKSYHISETYQATGMRFLFDEENGYELAYPDIFPQLSTPPRSGQALALESEDGQARLGVTFTPGTLEELETAWKADGGQASVNEFGQLAYQAPGELRLASPDAQTGQCVVLTLTYPEGRPHEYDLYWEFLTNSFVVYAFAAG
ncbi:MAG: hypothetical protein PHP02_04735 [Eubacteriales bacterium]|nr:hypothetical protein [Eubacteriales bacterium]